VSRKPKNPWRAGSAAQFRQAVMKRRPSERKMRLHAVACCRLMGKSITHPDCVALVDLIERRADDDTLAPAVTKLRGRVRRWTATVGDSTSWFSRFAAWASAEPHPRGPVWGFTYWYPFRDVLAEVLGPRDALPPFDPAWRTDTAVALARQMYESRDFGAMPILADALQDAGCDTETVLSHCRDAHAAHVRGCWVVDLVLGRE
jgi:hypothetical protein